MSEYTEQAENFLKAHGLEFRSVLVGDDCPKFCEDAQAGRDMDKVNTFPRKSHIHGKHYRCTISGTDRGHVAFDFWNSYADEEFNALGSPEYRKAQQEGRFAVGLYKYGRIKRPVTPENAGLSAWMNGPKKTPEAYDLLACIEKNEPGTFKDFCGDFGYSDDSMKAFDVYRAVQEEYAKFRRFFTAEEIAEAQEIS
jgi:hypothetical protein